MYINQRLHLIRNVICLVLLSSLSYVESAIAVCGTQITWQANANTTAWNTTTNWNPNNVPNAATETAFIRADWQIPLYPGGNITLSCLEINSGSMTVSAAGILSIDDDYFRNLNTGALIVPGGSTWQVSMIGTAAQTFENVDPIPRLNISNATTVTLTRSFAITNDFSITAGSGQVIIQGDVDVQQTTAVTIPASATVIVEQGATLRLNGGATVNGTLKIMPGGNVFVANGRTLAINAGGTLQIAGAPGNAGNLDSYSSGSTFNLNVAGKIDAEYFYISRLTAAGLNVTGQIQELSYGSFNYIANGAYGITLGAAAVVPANLNYIGFYGQTSTTPRNVNASAFNISNVTFNDWSGAGDTPNELDGNNRIAWGTQAAVELLVSDNSPTGAPPTTIGRSSAYTHFGTFAFALSGTSTATDITSIKFTIDGVNLPADLAGARVYIDSNANCTYNAGVDTQVGGTFTPAGIPASFTATFTAGQIQTGSTTPGCVHVLLATSATAATNNTIGVEIAATDDVVNSQNYTMSLTSSPPVTAGTATITGSTIYKWQGGNSTTMNQANNWLPNTVPNNTRDCEIGSGYAIPVMGGAFACFNMDLLTGGTINWNNTANIFSLNGSLSIGSTYTFQNTTATAIIRFTGTSPQSINMNGVTFPGQMQMNGTGPMTFESSGTISGALAMNTGITRIASGVTLTVTGAITIASGATLDIEPGATLVRGNGSTITVAAGGTLEMIGSTTATANIRAINDASTMTIAVTGTIRAQYYTLRNFGASGLTINAAATIDATYHLQNGSYSRPGINNAVMLRLLRQVPTNTLADMVFDAAGSANTGVIAINTTTAGAGTLTVSNYSGDRTGAGFTTAPVYLVSWTTPTNTIDLTQEATAPASSNQGATVTMGRFGFQQTTPGAYANTDVTYMRLTLTGTGTANDIDAVRLYYDAGCTGAGGTLVGTQTFSGNPARADFSGITGATVETHATTPPKRCFYVQFDLDSLATNGATVGVQIQTNSHVTNSQGYAFNGSAGPPISLGNTSIVGSSTYWTGAAGTTAWATAGNWSGGVPTNALNCYINSAAFNPTITTAAVCKSVTIGTGALTLSGAGASLTVYGSFDNSGTFTQNGRPLTIADTGVASAQSISSTTTLESLAFNKTLGGSFTISSGTLNVTNLITMGAGNNFTFYVPSNKVLSAIGGMTVSAGNLTVQSGGTIEIGNNQTLTLSGGTIATTGTNDAYPQSLSNKANFTRRSGATTWNFTATSGTLDLVGFMFEWLGTNGVNIGGTTNVTQINGGQLRNLNTTAGMRAIQFNNSGSLPTTISNFGWYWGPNNVVPGQATSYWLGYSSGCGNRTVTFDQWFGDFWPYTGSVTPDNHISEVTCNIVIDKANSPVSLTEFKATSYDGKVLLEWTTGLEWYHMGFNVYRSLSPSSGFIQINSEMIRNDMFSTTLHGTYAFIDEDADNDVTYYYMLEDIASFGDRTFHGPLSATPNAAYGPPPPPLANTIVSSNPGGSQSSGGAGSNASAPGLVELEPNITLMAKTASSFRLKISIPAPIMTPDVSHPAYDHASIPLYSPTLDAGRPELLGRTFMLKIPEAASAQFELVSSQSNTSAGVQLAPAPAWVVNNNQYEYQWALDAAAYAQNSMLPASPIALGTVVNNNGQHYLPVLIKPLAYNPVSQDLKKFTEIIVDVFLDNHSDWAPQSPLNLAAVWGAEGALRIGIQADGVFQLTYDDMLARGVIAPFDLADVSKFKLYYMNQEQPLDITSGSGLFSSGDSIRFFSRKVETVESRNSYVVLVNDAVSPIPGLRMPQVDVSVLAGQASPQSAFNTRVHVEENNVAVFNEPYDQDMDLFVWGQYYAISGGAFQALTTDVQLPHLVPDNTVTVQAMVKSRRTTSNNYSNNLQLIVNNATIPGGDVSFQGSNVQTVSFVVDPVYFLAGKNKITLQPTGNNLIAGEYDIVYIDSLDIYYSRDWMAEGDQILFESNQAGVDVTVGNFSSNQLYVYDLSQFGNAERLVNAPVALNGTYEVSFKTSNDPSMGRRVWISTAAELLVPSSLELNYGSHLADVNNQADVIYVGSEDLLDAVEPLAAFRRSQGYKTQLVSLKSIYNEFGQGLVTHESIRDFFIHAAEQWSVKPRYFVLLGDGTYDPKAYQNDEIANRFPVKLIQGAAFNYGSDHWYVTRADQLDAFAVVGRIPARTQQQLREYVDKVLAYENGTTKPASASMKVLSDKAHYDGENFDAFSNELISNINIWQPGLAVSNLSRTQLGDAAFKTQMSQSFGTSSVIHYMGHGAENMWADTAIFNTNDVASLNNTKLPVIAAMNCLNANYYDPDLVSLAETLVMKKDGGAIAFWGSTSMTPPSVQAVYQNAFYERLLASSSSPVGDAVKMSKIQASQQSPFAEAVLSWTIIGDPMVKAVVPESTAATSPASAGGGSKGCSALGNYAGKSNAPAWDLIMALFLEFLLALAILRLFGRLSK